MSNSHVHPIFRGICTTVSPDPVCSCGNSIDMEMERDVMECVQCQADKMMANLVSDSIGDSGTNKPGGGAGSR